MNISKYNLSEIFFILEDEGIYQDVDISTNDRHIIMKTNIYLDNPYMRKINGHMIDKLKKATEDIKKWLNSKGRKYDVRDEYDSTEEGFVHTIDIEEIN